MVKSMKTSGSNVGLKKHEDRELAAKAMFEVTSIDIQTPETMILLLECKEDMVVLKALATLDKYASRLEQNAQILFEADILKPLLPLLHHSELYIKRFATKLLSELNFLPPVADSLLQQEILPLTMEILKDSEDFIVKEFSLSIIAELTKTNSGVDQLKETNLIMHLIPQLSEPDPDIQKNCLQIISNLVQNPLNHSLITSEPEFNIKVFINLMMSEYVAIQNLTLDVLDLLTQKTKGNNILKSFQDEGGIQKIMTILKNFEWKDIHCKCLNVLGNIYSDPNIAQNFLKDGILYLFNYMKIISDPLLRKKSVEVIAKITATPLGRKIMAESNHIANLVAMISEQSSGLTAMVCEAVSGLVQDYESLQQVLEANTVSDLLTVLADDSRDWDTKTAAVNALYQILKRDVNACSYVVDSDKMEVIASILNQYDGEIMPTFAASTAANCITTISNMPELKQKIVNRNLISSLLHCFKDFKEDTTTLKLSACEALCSLLTVPKTRSLLKSLDGLPIVWRSITKHPNNIQFLQAAANFVHLCISNSKDFTATLLQLDVINWLLSQGSLRNECPAWEVALESVLSKFLPLKFAMTGRLDLTDITENNFYITRFGLTRDQLSQNKFPVMSDLIINNSCPLQTLYYANFDDVDVFRASERDSIKTSLTSQSELGLSSLLSSFSSNYGCEKFQFADHNLQKYVNMLQEILCQNGFSSNGEIRDDNVVDGDTIRTKSLLIGKFVAKQMCGVDKAEICSIHTLDLHINELKLESMNNMIGVGWMRVGLHTERALLFKVLADRVGLPAGLVRGKHRRAWVEVAIPNIPPAPRPSYPNHLLRPNFIVDLMTSPGTLYPLNSYESDVYCGLVEI